MAHTRPQVEGVRPGRRRPAARPGDPFAAGAAARGAAADAEAIARGLAEFAPKLGRLSEALVAKHKEEKLASGRARFLALAEEADTVRQAVEQGLANEDNPFFRAGLLEQAGIIAADRFGAFLLTRVGTELQGSTSLDEFDEVAQQALDDFRSQEGLDDAPAELVNGFRARAAGQVTGVRRNFASQIPTRLREQASEQAYQEAFTTITTGLTQGSNIDEIADQLTATLDELAQRPGETSAGRSVNNAQVLEAIIFAAFEREDPAILELARKVGTGPGGQAPLVGRSGALAQRFVQAQEQLGLALDRKSRRESAALQEAQDRRRAAIMTEAAGTLLDAEDPSQVDLDPFVAELTRLGMPEKVSTLRNLQTALVENTFQTNRSLLNKMAGLVVENPRGATPGLLIEAVAPGGITLNDFITLNNLREGMLGRGPMSRALSAPRFEEAVRSIDNRIGSISASGVRVATKRTERAKTALRLAWLRKVAADPGILEDEEAMIQWLEGRVQTLATTFGDPSAERAERVEEIPFKFNWRSEIVTTEEQLETILETARANLQGTISEAEARARVAPIANLYGVTGDEQIAEFMTQQISLMQKARQERAARNRARAQIEER